MFLLQLALQDLAQEGFFYLRGTVRGPAKGRLFSADFFDVFLQVFDAGLNVVSHTDDDARRDPTSRDEKTRLVVEQFRGLAGI